MHTYRALLHSHDLAQGSLAHGLLVPCSGLCALLALLLEKGCILRCAPALFLLDGLEGALLVGAQSGLLRIAQLALHLQLG